MKMDRQPGDENREIKIDAGKSGKTKRDRKKVNFFHAENILSGHLLSRTSFSQIK